MGMGSICLPKELQGEGRGEKDRVSLWCLLARLVQAWPIVEWGEGRKSTRSEESPKHRREPSKQSTCSPKVGVGGKKGAMQEWAMDSKRNGRRKGPESGAPAQRATNHTFQFCLGVLWLSA